MKELLKSKIGQLRIVAFLEGVSLLVLIFIGMPFKYWLNNPSLVKTMGPIHGILFLLFAVTTIGVGVEQSWKFKITTWKVLLSSFIPFGTFYIDKKILREHK
jgi:integral membrane protein